MSQVAFSTSFLGWQDFYLASSGASAALLGLLFVGVSINLGAIASRDAWEMLVRVSEASRT
jgi:hypothetical protein